MQSGQEDTLEERYVIKFCFKLGKTATETYGMLQTAYGPSCMNRSSVFQWHKRFKEGRESVRDDERCGRSREVRTSEMIGQINDFINRGRHVSIETLSAQFNVSVGAVHIIIREELKISYRLSQWHLYSHMTNFSKWYIEHPCGLLAACTLM